MTRFTYGFYAVVLDQYITIIDNFFSFMVTILCPSTGFALRYILLRTALHLVPVLYILVHRLSSIFFLIVVSLALSSPDFA